MVAGTTPADRAKRCGSVTRTLATSRRFSVSGRHSDALGGSSPHASVSTVTSKIVPVAPVTVTRNRSPEQSTGSGTPAAVTLYDAVHGDAGANAVVHALVPVGHSSVPGANDWHSPVDALRQPPLVTPSTPQPLHTFASVSGVEPAVPSGNAAHSRAPMGHTNVPETKPVHAPLGSCWHGPCVPTKHGGHAADGIAGVSTKHWNAPAGHRDVDGTWSVHVPSGKWHTPVLPPTHAGHSHGAEPVGHTPSSEGFEHTPPAF